ncbi:Methyltransferase domain-containing protein [Actinokineospora alba]|uniref:Methyltransferase domain-containing protein n=1 Tax=Actinokineospora alba TaxID=504798 RepID=A0A1H0FA36_9PSEU|nr:class I SAM-dependent methyltransferase [Actinokineospora alba]TDP69397.1 methyltransferase family protein [Actinokineospora alba]SDI17574.1 Methyltransferase domain-containing protein [Actinokineospora alba]SDN91372.1 Methyltransferase domain-containing protein [Actinokineospora alba]
MKLEDEQHARWNGTAGNAWVEAQGLLDGIFRPLEDLLAKEVAGRRRVLDVGCGTGGTTVAIARGGAECVGVDISETMVAAAEKRARQAGVDARFLTADAGSHEFEPGAFDAVVSRFGVMFFADPTAAFTTLRQAAADGAALRMIVWRDIADNPFMTVAETAAAPLLPDLPARDPHGPGQFAFADPGKVERTLSEAGWHDADLRALNVECAFPESELVGYFTRLGPVGIALSTADAPTRDAVTAAVRPAFAPFVHGGEVRFTAACWLVTATA